MSKQLSKPHSGKRAIGFNLVATFDDLLDKQDPLTIATGTDITTASRFSYIQDDFDLLCSDVGPVHQEILRELNEKRVE